MINHKDIFEKYGLHSPEKLVIPTEKEVEENIENLSSYNRAVGKANSTHLSSYNLCMLASNRTLKIKDHTKFNSFLNLDIDFSKIHPKLFCSIDFYFRLVNNDVYFGALLYDLFESFNKKDLNEYLTHFSSGYPLQKMFSSSAESKTKELLKDYLRTTLNEILIKASANAFIEELYDYILQEQNKLETKTQ